MKKQIDTGVSSSAVSASVSEGFLGKKLTLLSLLVTLIVIGFSVCSVLNGTFFMLAASYCGLVSRDAGKQLACYEKAIQVNPQLAEAYAGRARVKLFHYDVEPDMVSIKQDIKHALQLAPNNLQVIKTALEVESFRGTYQGQVQLYERLIQTDKSAKTFYLHERANLAYQHGDLKQELADRKAIVADFTRDPMHERQLFELAEEYLFLGDLKKSISIYERLASKAADVWTLVKLANLYRVANDHESAINTLSKAIEGKRTNNIEQVTAIYHRAELLAEQKKFSKALLDAETLTVRVKGEKAHAFHAQILHSLNRNAEADKELKASADRLNAVIRKDAKANKQQLAYDYSLRGQFYQYCGQYQKALRDYESAAKLDERSALPQLGCAQTHFALGHYEKALRHFAQIVDGPCEIKSLDELQGGRDLRAQIYLKQHKPELAVKDCTALLSGYNSDGSLSYWRGKAYEQLGKPELAAHDLNEALGHHYWPTKGITDPPYCYIPEYDEANNSNS